MLDNNPNTPRLRIWQQNLNTSFSAQHDLLNNKDIGDFDILILQEPYINYLGLTSANRHFRVLYPTLHRSNPDTKTRAVTLVSTKLDTNAWTQTPFPSSDVVLMQLKGDFGTYTLFNIYNDGTHDRTITTLGEYLDQHPELSSPPPQNHMVWLGDFNRHHPLWEEERNSHLLTNAYLEQAQSLIELLAEHGMVMTLPKDTPTLEALATKNWTRPDNVFCTDHTTEYVIQCYTDPARRGPCTDHVPIFITIDLAPPTLNPPPTRNYKEVDWKKFNNTLTNELNKFPTDTPIVTEAEFQRTARGVTDSILHAIDTHIPLSHPSPFTKRWWTHDLTQMRKELKQLARSSYDLRNLPHHPVHDQHRKHRNRYSEEIKKTKKNHWMDWLESISSEEIWIANKYLNAESSDGSAARIPTLTIKQPDGTQDSAASNNEKSEALAQAFFPPPPGEDSTPNDFHYPDPLPDPTDITREQIERAITKLSPMKAPGPDGIRNVILQRCSKTLIPHFLRLFRAVFLLNTYFDPWREFTTVVLRKPGKADYTVPKAYRPIALLNTTGKLLSAIVADHLSHLIEHHQLIPGTHFGGRPGRSTTDSLHLLEATVKNAWRAGKVVSALFLDIEGAFPNAVTSRLLHNMRKRRIPLSIISFTRRLLQDRRTRLSFDGFFSEWIPIINGIGQGDPLSMVLYIVYNSDLVEVANKKSELTLAFVDDTAFLAIGNDFHETHKILGDMLERPGGGYEWSKLHNSRFETTKFALIDLSHSKTKERPPLTIRGITIKPTDSHRFLGVLVDEGLRWNKHINYAIGKGTAYVMQLRRVAKSAHGVPAPLARQLYTAVALPKMLYAIDLWFKPIFSAHTDTPNRGSIGTAKRIARVQRLAVIAITGAMRTTATDVLEAHTKLMPVDQRIQLSCHRAALRMAALPSTHPLHPLLKRAAKSYVKCHRSSLHYLTHSFDIQPGLVETIVPTRNNPTYSSPYTIKIAKSKLEASIKEHDKIIRGTKVYCDGSGTDGSIGAAAVLYLTHNAQPKTLRYHLGKTTEHTVSYEVEAVGLSLAAKLLLSELDLETPITIFVDNQAVIQAGACFISKPSHYLIDHASRLIRLVKRKHRIKKVDITVQWIAGHSEVEGNELADIEAKGAAKDGRDITPRNRLPKFLQHGPLPLSISALIQQQTKTETMRWAKRWKSSPRFHFANRTDPGLLSGSFLKLAAGLTRRQTSLLIWLRTNHCPLNVHLHRIRKADTPFCAACPGEKENVRHYLLHCPQYARQRAKLAKELKRKSLDIPHMLTTYPAIKHTLNYVSATLRLRDTLGDVSYHTKSAKK